MNAENAVAGRAQGRLWAWLDDRLNPILVKEVRQALRGRYFRNMFWLTVVAATGISILAILNSGPHDLIGRLGPAFFLANYGVMAIAINAFVPFWAFQSMSGEWEENTYDLLVISNLRPRQLLVGKALAAAVQSLLFFCAFAPYLTSTFLMGGVDLVSIVLVLAATLLMSIGLSIVGIALASFGRSRLVRAVLAVAFIGTLLGLGSATIAMATAIIRQPEILRGSDFGLVAGVFFSILLLVTTLALAVGCARLAHEHENRSTFLRVVVSLVALVLLGWGIYGALWGGATFQEEFLWAMPSTVLSISIIPFLFFVTEPEPLGRRVEKQVPRSRLLALLSFPFLPGGGRGLWLYLATAVATVAVAAATLAIGNLGGFASRSGAGTRAENTLIFLVTMFAYGFVVIGLLSGIASFHIRSLRGRTGVRIAIPLAVVLALVVPTLLGFLVDIRRWRNFEHPFNPVWTFSLIDRNQVDEVSGALALLVLGVLVTFVVNGPRLSRSIAETLRASAARRERERAARS